MTYLKKMNLSLDLEEFKTLWKWFEESESRGKVDCIDRDLARIIDINIRILNIRKEREEEYK